MDPRYYVIADYVIAAWLSSFMLQTKQPQLPEATFKPFELSNVESAS
jgi:hypothetical protein